MRVIAVSAGKPKLVDYQTSSLPATAIEKHRVSGPVLITADGVAGDDSADRENHHDEWMRVYAYSVEDYRWWAGQLGVELTPGQFGEQLTTEGVDLGAALVGETWRVGTALLQIAHIRIPCQTFKGWMGHLGYDDTAWVKRFTLAGRPGPYLRVLEEGVVEEGDPIVVESRPDHDVSVGELFRAVTVQPALLPRLLAVPGLKPWIYERAAKRGMHTSR
jgi:MOSC domain-containing protein YiiM